MKRLIILVSVFIIYFSLSASDSKWVNVGNAGFSAGIADTTSLALDSSGTPFVAFKDGGNSDKATVMKFSGTGWETVGTAGFSAGDAYDTDLAFDSSGTPFVAFQDKGNSGKATVMKFNGTTWETVGTAGFSAGAAYDTSLALDSSGTPFVAFQDKGTSDKATVMKFNGTGWETVGTAGFSAGGDYDTSLALDSSGTPFVAFLDGDNSYKVTVMKFNGTGWETVGTAGFSAGGADYTSLALDSSGTPFVAFRDGGNSDKATVMKFNGTGWETVGTAGFSADVAYHTSLAFDSSGTPFVAFQDKGNSYKATVMKFNGTTWETVGSAGFSAGMAGYTDLVLDSSGTPFVAFKDEGNSWKATVMKFLKYIDNIEDDQVGTNCDSYGFGGRRIIEGYDDGDPEGVANNGILEEGEIDSTTYICYAEDSPDRHNSIILIDSEVGTSCDAYGNGGQRIRTGLDDGTPTGIADNNSLEDGEVESTVFVCNGADGTDGKTVLVSIIDEPAGENCVNGGKKVEAGIDDNGNGTLETGEIDSTDFVCNGDDGADGEDGADGADGEDGVDGVGEKGDAGTDGTSALVNSLEEPAGDNCENGGIRLDSGIDKNSDGELSEDEVQNTSYICGGATGKSGSGCSVTEVDNESPAFFSVIISVIEKIFPRLF
jgi:hypothetical protein